MEEDFTKTGKLMLIFFTGLVFLFCLIYLVHSYLTYEGYRGPELHLIPIFIIGLISMALFISFIIDLIKAKINLKEK